MTQPPDDRTPPPSDPVEPSSDDDAAAPDREAAAPDAPTVAWTPPGGQPSTPEPESSSPAPEGLPPSPIISADTSASPPTPGWEIPATPPPPVPAAAGGGWQVATTPAPTVGPGGYVVGGAGARFVAWLIDGVLSSIIPGAIFFLIFDWTTFFRNYFDQFHYDASGRLVPNADFSMTFPITLDLVLVLLILVGVQFLYFVGFWTSRWQATPGMIGLKMRVVDANTGAPLTLTQAVKRWFAMGWWLGALVVVPVLGSASSLAEFAVNVFLFLSTVIDDRRRGFHDKFAGSQVIRSVTSGSGATIVGCLVYVILIFLISVIAIIVLLPAMAPVFERLIQEYPGSSI
jgi:uncharacterized RDD family membrane protein YckC